MCFKSYCGDMVFSIFDVVEVMGFSVYMLCYYEWVGLMCDLVLCGYLLYCCYMEEEIVWVMLFVKMCLIGMLIWCICEYVEFV